MTRALPAREARSLMETAARKRSPRVKYLTRRAATSSRCCIGIPHSGNAGPHVRPRANCAGDKPCTCSCVQFTSIAGSIAVRYRRDLGRPHGRASARAAARHDPACRNPTAAAAQRSVRLLAAQLPTDRRAPGRLTTAPCGSSATAPAAPPAAISTSALSLSCRFRSPCRRSPDRSGRSPTTDPAERPEPGQRHPDSLRARAIVTMSGSRSSPNSSISAAVSPWVSSCGGSPHRTAGRWSRR